MKGRQRVFDWLRDLVVPVRRVDPRFGSIRYLRSGGFWEGKASFQPLGRPVEVLIWDDAQGPTEDQRRFFNDLEDRYDAVWPVFQQAIVAEAEKLGAATEGLELACVDVPQTPGVEAEWAVSYETQPRSWHFTLQLRGWTPEGVIAEC